MRVLVTGAGGYIGRHVVKRLLECGYEVVAIGHNLDKLDSRVIVNTTDIFCGDRNIYFQVGEPDVCIHLAWVDGFVHNSKAHMLNLSKHFEFLSNMVDGGLKSLSVMGTMHEVGYHVGSIDENTQCNPQSQYGISKNALRQSLTLFMRSSNCALHWLRAYYIVGDDEKANSIFSKIIKAEKEKKTEFPFTSGTNKYDFIDIDELANMIVMASVQTTITGIINVCSGQPVALSDRVEQFIQENNFKIKLKYNAYPDRPYDSPIVYGDSKKIKEIMSCTENTYST